MKDWAFCLAFVCMGLELSVGEFKKMGWSPVIVYLIVTVFNTLLALVVVLADLRLAVPGHPGNHLVPRLGTAAVAQHHMEPVPSWCSVPSQFGPTSRHAAYNTWLYCLHA